MLHAVEQVVLIVLAVTLLAVIASVTVAAVVTVRAVRRRYRTGRERLRSLSLPSVRQSGDLAAFTAVAATTVGSPGWWVVQNQRRQMWRMVLSAEHAVGVAQRSGTPVGDLPALMGQLKSAAGGVDAVLRASASTPSMRGEARAERERVEAAAADVHRAALDSLATVASADTAPVVSAVRMEVAALAAGLRAARRAG